MPEQLIYTSAPRGLVAGRSGHCTVAHTAGMREALRLQLEKWSYYQHHALTGGKDRPIYSYRITEIRGSHYYVLSKIQDSGLDFTGRTNFVAHHLVFTPEEIRQFPSPPIILRDWKGWVASWSREPQLLEKEDWSGLPTIQGSVSIPAKNWLGLTGDAVNGYGLLEARAGIAFRVDGLLEREILTLFAESLALLELPGPRGDFRGSAWQYTFTTSMQEQDNPADYRWRCLFSDNPASSRFAGPDSKNLIDVRPARVSNQEGIFARKGPQAPKFVKQPQNVTLTLGETTTLSAEAEGVPTPQYQWFSVDRNGNSQEIRGATGPEFFVHNPPLGTSRYLVRAINPLGAVDSNVAALSIEHAKSASPARTSSQARPEIDVQPVAQKPKTAHGTTARDNANQGTWREPTEVYGKRNPVWEIAKITCVILICFVVLGVLAIGVRQIQPFWKSKVKTPTPDQIAEKTNGVPALGPTNPNPASESSNTVKTPPQINRKLPQEWESIAFGQILEASASLADTRPAKFTLSARATGPSHMWDNSLFVHQPFSELFRAIPDYTDPTPADCYVGIMWRASVETNSAFCFIGRNATETIACHRDANGEFKTLLELLEPELQSKQILFSISHVTNSLKLGFGSSPHLRPSHLDFDQKVDPGSRVGFAIFLGPTNIHYEAKIILTGKK